MAKRTKKEEEKMIEFKAQANGWWKSAKDSRDNIDWRWFLYDLWVNGYHYAKWDRETRQITTSVSEKGKPKIVINQIYVTLRAVRNFVLRNRPRAEATPENLTPENMDQVIKLNKFLDYLHEKLRIRQKLKATVWHALKYSLGWWHVYWDEQKQEVAIDVVDPYDFYPDPIARTPEEMRFCILAVRRGVEEVKNDKMYREYIKENEIELKPDGKLSASSHKERFMNLEQTGSDSRDDQKSGTVLVKQIMFKEWDEDNEKYIIKIAAMVDETIIRKPEATELEIFPFFRLMSDVEPLKMYGTGWVKNLIPANKLLNRLESSVAEYNDIINKGKWVSDKGAGVRIINNEHGQIIEKKRGFDIGQVSITPINASVFRQIENVLRYIEDLGGKHDASMGRMPTGAKSGKALEALQVGDSNNMSEIVENVEIFLEEVFEYVLDLVSSKYQFARNIIPLSTAGERDFISVIGSGAQEEIVPDGATVVSPKNTVDVKISSWLAETQEARRDVLAKLYELQAIDQETLLKGFGLSSVGEIIRQSQAEKQMQMQAETEQQVTLANAQNQQTPTEPAPNQAGAMQANAALQELLSGSEPEIPADLSPDFLAYIDQFIQSPEFSELPQQEQGMVQSFRNQVAISIR